MKSRKFYILIFFITSSLFINTANSQTINAKAFLDTNIIMIGDQIKLKIDVNYPKKLTPRFNLYSDTLTDKIEIIGPPKIDTIKKNGDWLTLRQTYTITSFDSGYHKIPPFEISFSDKSDTISLQRVFTDTLFLTVNVMPVDTAGPFKDIKEPFDVPITFDEILPYILWGLLIIAIISVSIYLYKRFKSKKPIFTIPEKPKDPPHVVALKALKELEEKKLWQQGLVKNYYSELSDIIRKYLEEGFQIKALEMTTYEILNNDQIKNLDLKSKELLKQILELSDLVKFAKYLPIANEHSLVMENSVEFVNITSSTFTKADTTTLTDETFAIDNNDKKDNNNTSNVNFDKTNNKSST